MKNFQLTDEEKTALLEKIKSYPRPEKFAKQEATEEPVVEAAVEETTTEEPAPVKKPKSKKTNQ